MNKSDVGAGRGSVDRFVRLRIEMAEKGWHTEDRLTTEGWGNTVGYSIWFSRWDWHGKRLHGNRACYHAHGYVSDGVDKIVERAAGLAKSAWEIFPSFPPDQLADGSLRESVFKPNDQGEARAGSATSPKPPTQ